jgi:hypothetical protein
MPQVTSLILSYANHGAYEQDAVHLAGWATWLPAWSRSPHRGTGLR